MLDSRLKSEIKQGRFQTGYAEINGLRMYYEVHGNGQPLVLLHGGLGGISMFAPILPDLSKNRCVIGVDLQGNGHTADIDHPFSFEQMADDIAALIEHLKLLNSDLMGYSLGGGVALQTAIRHPEMVRKLVLVSTAIKSEDWYPEVRAGMRALNAEAARTMVGSPPYQAYIAAAPNPAGWENLVIKTGNLVSQDYDWSKSVTDLKMPVMIAVGDADAIRPTQAVKFFELLGGGQADPGWDKARMPRSRLAILPGTTHYDIIQSPILSPIVNQFLDAPMPD